MVKGLLSRGPTPSSLDALSPDLLYDWAMRQTAREKPKVTMADQATLPSVEVEVAMWARPWMVEVARNSRRTSILPPVILTKGKHEVPPYCLLS